MARKKYRRNPSKKSVAFGIAGIAAAGFIAYILLKPKNNSQPQAIYGGLLNQHFPPGAILPTPDQLTPEEELQYRQITAKLLRDGVGFNGQKIVNDIIANRQMTHDPQLRAAIAQNNRIK